jgi:hypothetical protein
VIDTLAAPTPVPPALRVLLRGIVDYAGLFPPASLEMTAAASEYANYRAGPDAWALGRFVLPAARLDEFEAAAAGILPRDAAGSWALSALLGSDLEEDIARIERFNERHGDVRAGAVIVDTVELRAHTARDVARASELLDRRFDTYMELPVGAESGELVEAIAQTTAKAKIRTGGVTQDAFPTSDQVARFLASCVARGVAFKATAGLHHPWRAEYPMTYAPDAPRGVMFGFLNVLLAVALLRAGAGVAQAAQALEEREPAAMRLEGRGDELQWRTFSLPMPTLAATRESLVAFGSCSFREPLADLRALQLL